MDDVVSQICMLFEELSPWEKIFITSGDLDVLVGLKCDFEHRNIERVVFLSVQDILNGHLRGRFGRLLVFDDWALSKSVRYSVLKEEESLTSGIGVIDE